MPADNRYAFLVEWLDPQAQLVRQYLLFFYSIDGTVEMVRAFSPNPAALPAAGRPGACRCDLCEEELDQCRVCSRC
jgi:hypothetical protein